VTLTDIQGLEDHIGDMDFKVAGSRDGVTALQLDIKVKSIGFDIIKDALGQAREARLFLLERIRETIQETRTELSPYAPRMVRISIPVDKIGALIGPGGKTIRGIIEETKTTVDVQDDGTVTIGSTDGEASERAISMIGDLTREVQIGEIFTGKVVKITGFGAFIELLPGRDGMVHISELADYHVPSVEDVVELGEDVTVLVTDIDPMGRIKLSRRALLRGSDEAADGEGSPQPAESRVERAGVRGDPRPGQSRPPYSGGRSGDDRTGYRPDGPRRGGNRGSGPRPFNRRPPR
jgi:polyribonucleotide nucleotidyltransferase